MKKLTQTVGASRESSGAEAWGMSAPLTHMSLFSGILWVVSI